MTGRGPVWKRTKTTVLARSGGRCESPEWWKDRFGCDGPVQTFHHVRRRRSVADDLPSNAIGCCHTCHQAAHAHPALAYEHGMLARQHTREVR